MSVSSSAGRTTNDPKSTLSIAERFEAFHKDVQPQLRADASVVKAAEVGLRSYRERHEREARQAGDPPRRIKNGAPFPSDFVDTKRSPRIQPGDLFYALVEGNDVRGLYPVAFPRLSHEHSRGSLLHPDFHPCTDPQVLCPACRVFGWVRPAEGKLTPEPRRIDAIASHVRFTHATLDRGWGAGDRRPRLATLAILGSPKPTTTAFYLRPREHYAQARSNRWPPVFQKALHENILLYRQDEATVRGRKFYRLRQPVDPNSHDPATGGVLRSPGDDGQPARNSKNQTVHLLPPGLAFSFRVYFDNLSREELGALAFALSLCPPSAWGAELPLRHALGHGKPLGLGASEVRITRVQIDNYDLKDAGHRYAQLPTFGEEADVIDAAAENALSPHLAAFADAWVQAEQRNAAVSHTRLDLLEMLRADPPDGPLHYPTDPDADPAKSYGWFVKNRHPQNGGGRLLPEPRDERHRPECRLPGRPSR